MAPGDLTTLAHAKDWLGLTVDTSDSVIARLISSNSAYIQAWLDRTIALQTYTETRDGSGIGKGRYAMMPGNLPLWDVLSLSINGNVIIASPDNGIQQPGYAFDEKLLWLARNGCGFIQGQRNVSITYRAGFVSSQLATIPTSPYQLTLPFTWLSDVSVLHNGVAMQSVTGAPAAGQYAVVDGVYTFNAADVMRLIVINYSFVPPDIEQACIDMLSLSYRGMSRIGEVSKAIGTQTVTFVQKAMTDNVKALLSQYVKVVPLP